MTRSTPLDLLLVEDDEAYAEVLAEDLRAMEHAVRVVGDGRAAIREIDRVAFDAVILDWMLPMQDGISVLRQLRGADQAVPVILLTALGQSAEKVQGLEAGADDYVVKPATAEELNARIHAILRGRGWSGQGDTIAAGDIVVSPATFRAWQDGKRLDLGRLQFKLLAELVRNADNVVTRAMLIQRVWGYDFEPSANIVEAQVFGLRGKLSGAGSRSRIATVRGVGYMLRS